MPSLRVVSRTNEDHPAGFSTGVLIIRFVTPGSSKLGYAQGGTIPLTDRSKRLSMVESTIELDDASEGRRGMTFEIIRDESKQKLGTFPGMPAIWWMPIQTRTEMLSTGIRSNIGIKILGSNLAGIQKLAEVIEGRMKIVKDAGTVVAERITGGYFIDFTVKRKQAARFGLVADIKAARRTWLIRERFRFCGSRRRLRGESRRAAWSVRPVRCSSHRD